MHPAQTFHGHIKRLLVDSSNRCDPGAEWDTAHPWQRQPCDCGPVNYNLFKSFLFKPSRRVATGDFLLSRQAFWEYRAHAYDLALEDLFAEERATRLVRHLGAQELKATICEEELTRIADEQSKSTVSGVIRPELAFRGLDQAQEMQWRLTGRALPAPAPSGDDELAAIETLSPDELATLRTLLAKAKGDIVATK